MRCQGPRTWFLSLRAHLTWRDELGHSTDSRNKEGVDPPLLQPSGGWSTQLSLGLTLQLPLGALERK